jgi:hypothetical protein
MRTHLLLAFASLTLAACASMDANECRGTDWYQIGYRDGLFGLQRRDESYAYLCGQHGVTPDRAAYGKGWQEGWWENDARRAHGGVD